MPTHKEKPIIMSAEMVRAILAGRKTETRRVIRFRCSGEVTEMVEHNRPFKGSPRDEVLWSANHRQPEARREVVEQGIRCPYGVPGDRLWVRETHLRNGEDVLCSDDSDWDTCYPSPGEVPGGIVWKVVSSIHMPKWAARIWLEVVEVRAERVRDITDEGVRAEGVEGDIYGEEIGIDPTEDSHSARIYFMESWDHLNAKRGFGFDANPWVWVIRFKRAKP